MKTHAQSGYILIFSLMITSLIIFIVTYMANQAITFSPYSSLSIDQQKAQLLAWGALEIGMSQLAGMSKDKENQKKAEETPQKKLLEIVLPILNRDQVVTLKEKIDGIDATLHWCVVCEEGKINLNALYDFEKKEFTTKEMQQMLKELFTRIEQIMGGKNLMQGFEKFIKERQYRINDVTELMNIKEFEVFKGAIFYDPAAQKEEVDKKKKSLYLTDLFTVWAPSEKIEPWLFSTSMQQILQLKGAAAGNKEARMQVIPNVLKNFKPKASWQTDWNTLLKPWYGNEFTTLPAWFTHLLSTTFNPRYFSIVCSVTLGQITYKLLAIVEQLAQESEQKNSVEVVMRKLYLL
jgi:hypothetical protein